MENKTNMNNMANIGNETKKTEQLIQIYKEDAVQENLRALIHQMKKSIFLVPAMLPDTPEVREVKQKVKENPGEKINLPKGVAPMPAILNNQKGEMFFPIYSSPRQVPKEPKADLLMHMPFLACCRMAMDERLGAQGLALNPFTDNLMFKKNLLDAIQKEGELPAGAKQVRLTPQQMQVRMRQKAEFHDFPARVFGEGAEFVHKLCDEKEALVHEIYQKAYGQQDLYPYDESSFFVMALNISEELLLVQVDLPDAKQPAQLCFRIYVTLNPKNGNARYFTVEKGKGKDERNLGEVGSDGRHIDHGEAPAEGAEIQRIMDIINAPSGDD